FGRTGWLLLAVVLAGVLAASLGQWLAAVLITALGALLVYGAAKVWGAGNGLWRAAGALYVGIPSTALLWLRGDSGAYAVLWLFLVVWATDIGAYACGRLIGGPRLAPRLSPNKTWAGLVGGLLAASAVGALLAPALGVPARGLLVGLSAILSLVSQAGDLLESALKRHFGVKDTSALIPGHGGLFDRVDGVLAAAPAAAVLQLLSGGSLLAWR
ncbi:MAG: phosphatidate cytidylyltransferase, partial [Alphaproteobacteria bacterium]